jgi:hypothetical protein
MFALLPRWRHGSAPSALAVSCGGLSAAPRPRGAKCGALATDAPRPRPVVAAYTRGGGLGERGGRAPLRDPRAVCRRGNLKFTGSIQNSQVGPAVWLEIPIRVLKLAQSLDQPCEFYLVVTHRVVRAAHRAMARGAVATERGRERTAPGRRWRGWWRTSVHTSSTTTACAPPRLPRRRRGRAERASRRRGSVLRDGPRPVSVARNLQG